MQYLLRRKITFLLVAFLMSRSFTGMAQMPNELYLPDHDSKLYHFGINLGFNKSHFSFTHHPRFINPQQNGDSVMVIESINNTGINLAWLVNLNISEHLDIRTYPLDLTFSEKAFEYSLKYPDAPLGENPVTIKKIQSISLSFPIQMKFSSDRINNMKVYMLGGIKLDYDLAANAGKKNAEDLVVLKPFDYAIEGGLGFHIYFPYFVLTPELKVSWGMANLHSRNPSLKFSSNIDQINSRMISISLTVE